MTIAFERQRDEGCRCAGPSGLERCGFRGFRDPPMRIRVGDDQNAAVDADQPRRRKQTVSGRIGVDAISFSRIQRISGRCTRDSSSEGNGTSMVLSWARMVSTIVRASSREAILTSQATDKTRSKTSAVILRITSPG